MVPIGSLLHPCHPHVGASFSRPLEGVCSLKRAAEARPYVPQHVRENGTIHKPWHNFSRRSGMATVEKRGYFTGWTPKTEGIIAPDERLPWGQSIFVGLQH